MIEYEFGGLTLIVRSESDGYIKSKLHGQGSLAEAPGVPKTEAAASSKDPELSELISSTSSVKVTPDTPVESSKLELRRTECKIPQAAIFDLKTRSTKTSFDMEEPYRRLWVNQTPTFIIAYHEFGTFRDIQIRDIRAQVEDWEERNQEALRCFQWTLAKLIEISKGPKTKFEVWFKGDGVLEIRELGSTGWKVLPTELKGKWAGREDEKEPKKAGSKEADEKSEDEEGEGDDSYLDF